MPQAAIGSSYSAKAVKAMVFQPCTGENASRSFISIHVCRMETTAQFFLELSFLEH